MARLIQLLGGEVEQSYALDGETVVLGRQNDSTVCLTGKNVSRHHAQILRRGNGEVTTLEATRPVLGLVKQSGAHAERMRLCTGDSLALYTDGISEATDGSGEEFGAERLRDLLSSGPQHGLIERHGQVLQTVREYAAGKLTDDATLVLLSIREGASAPTAIESEASCAQPQG